MNQLVTDHVSRAESIGSVSPAIERTWEQAELAQPAGAISPSLDSPGWTRAIASATCSLVETYRSLATVDRSMIPTSGEVTFELLCQSLCTALVFVDELGAA